MLKRFDSTTIPSALRDGLHFGPTANMQKDVSTLMVELAITPRRDLHGKNKSGYLLSLTHSIGTEIS